MAELLLGAREHKPHEMALADETTSVTWEALDRQVNRWIHVLRDRGLRPGDCVAVVARNRRETFEALLACLHTGLIVVPVNWHLTPAEITYLLDDAQVRAVIADAAHVEVAERAWAASAAPAAVRLVFGGAVPGQPDPPGDALPAAHGLSVADGFPAGFEPVEPLLAQASDTEPGDQSCGTAMLYTSGTTGRPKGVRLSLLRAGRPLAEVGRTLDFLDSAYGVPDCGRTLLCGPWYHSGQLFFSLFPLLRGSCLLTRHGFDATATLRLIDDAGITLTHLVPTQFIRLLRVEPTARVAFAGRSLRRVWHGGGPCPEWVKRAMIEWWGPVLMEYYAATEGGIATLIDSADWLDRPGSVGRPSPGTEVIIVDDDGAPVPPGTAGRIFVRRRGRTFSYHNAPEQTEAAHLRSGHFTYGDLGRMDSDGYLYLTGRAKDMIVSGGVNIYPAEVEAVLLDHPRVRDAAVIGVPDAEFGEQVRAVVEVDTANLPPADDLPDALDRFCRQRLAGFKVPRSYEFTDRLPREESGKLRKQVLRERYAQATVESR